MANKARLFYDTTVRMVTDYAQLAGVTNLSGYYSLTDYKEKAINHFGSGTIEQVFAQMAFHAQNAAMISNIIDFLNNYSTLEAHFEGFNSKAFLRKYATKDVPAIERDLCVALRIKNPGEMTTRYSKSLLASAKYLARFKNHKEVVGDLLKFYGPNKDARCLIEGFLNKIGRKNGFSIALACDFLKEFDGAFSRLPKPDTHLKDVLGKYYGKHYTNTNKSEYQCIHDFEVLLDDINSSGITPKITGYQLDRMIWLVCSGRFFLLPGAPKSIKDVYLSQI